MADEESGEGGQAAAPTEEADEDGDADADENAADEAPIAEATPRDERIATDPSTVQLAAGEPQFVEFFAYW